MLATFGLARLEAGLEKDTVTATDVAEFLKQAEPVDVRTLAREGMPEALDGMHRRIGHGADEAPYLPKRDEPPTDPLLVAAIVSAAQSDRPFRTEASAFVIESAIWAASACQSCVALARRVEDVPPRLITPDS